ncbi:MAG: PQQ-binding-like beta-propeller repeat protein [Planctomycetota bacterium]
MCRLAPGKFAAGFAVRRRNRVRSFTSPPLYHQGTIYHTTNAGAIAALDAQSGRVKWLIRYPYHIGIHDATRRFKYFYHCHTFGKDRDPSGGWLSWCDRYVLWPNQRPLLVGERLYVIPVDTRFFFCIDRRTGKVLWSRYKVKNDRSEPYGPGHRYFQNPGGLTYLLGPTREGRLVLVYSGHDHQVQLIDPDTGEMVWESPDTVEYDDSPVMSIFPGHFNGTSVRVKSIWVDTAARPFLDTDDRLSVMTDHPWGATYLCELDLPERRIVRRRRYYGGQILEMASRAIHVYGPPELKGLQDLPHKDKKTKRSIDALTKIVNDQVPVNKHGPFRACARVTFKRYGVPFELRFGARTVGMVYDRRAVRAALKERRGPQALFAKGELAYADARYADAARLLDTCLRTMPSEDLDFRSTVNQQLYQVHRQLARMAIRSGDVAGELAHGLGMARTGTVLADEIETLFALAEAYERRGDLAAAARCLRSIVRTYGHHEYPVAPVAVHHTDAALEGARGVMAKAEPFTKNEVYGRELGWSLDLLRDGLALYTSTVSPLPKPLTVRAGELASARLVRLRGRSKEFAAADEQVARKALAGRSPDEQLFRLPEFAGTDAAQRVLDALFDAAGKLPGVEGRRRLWRLADAARVSRLTVPDAYRAQVVAPPPAKGREPPAIPQQERLLDLAGAEGVNWLVLARRGQRANHPHLLFVGGRVRKRLDNKFILLCIDVKTGEPVWRKERIRLKGTGQEPGFFEAFVYRDVVVVHGLYDVLAFGLEDGALRWRFRGPFDFEIQHAAVSGDLLALSGKDETLALYLGATSPAGEVAWQVKESGDTYVAPYFCGDRFVSLRKNPYNLTVRYRATGRLMGRLALPDLSEFTEHPLLGEAGPRTLPVARDGTRLVVTDTFYYIMLDVSRPAVVWKRLIDANDLTRQPPLRFYLGGDHLLVLKEDYDQKAAWMLSAETGDILWRTDPKDPGSPRPLHSVVFGGGKLFGLGVHPGQGYAFVGRECKTGKRLFRVPVTGYAVKPAAALVPRLYGGYAVARVRDGQDFELRVFDIGTGKSVHTVGGKAAGEFGVHGQASATVQAGRVVLLTKNRLGL